MRLMDKLTFLDTDLEPLGTVPAQVGNNAQSMAEQRDENTLIIFQVEELRAIIKPHRLAVAGRKYLWNGGTYISDNDPMVRMRNGKEHHYTIKLKRIA